MKLRDATLVFLIRRDDAGHIAEICLAMKKRGFGMGRFNGVGGKVEDGETLEQAATRETLEEIGVGVSALQKVAELTFLFPHNPDWDQVVHTYFCEDWTGVPTESDEMKPATFKTRDIPYDLMWADDALWLPPVLAGNLVKATFTFAEGDVITHEDVKIVENF